MKNSKRICLLLLYRVDILVGMGDRISRCTLTAARALKEKEAGERRDVGCGEWSRGEGRWVQG